MKFLDAGPDVYQGVNVRNDGALIFQSGNPPYGLPDGVDYDSPGFSYIPQTEYGDLYVQTYDSEGISDRRGFLACPSGKNYTGPWQVFADLEGLKDSDVTGGKLCECLPMGVITWNATDADGPYQYV